MNARTRKGVGFIISGALFVLAGVMFIVGDASPEWLTKTLDIAVAVGAAVNVAIVVPGISSST